MGQLLSRQATSTKVSFETEPSASRSHHSRRERASYPGVDNGQTPRRSVHWDSPSIRTGRSTGAQGSRPSMNSLKETDGNIGAPRRQPKYGRGKNFMEPVRTKHAHKIDTPQIKPRTKDYHRHARPHTLKKSLHHKHIRNTKECIVCTNTRSLHRFPDRSPTEACSHDSDVCRRCLRTWIQSEFATKIWNEINCPICAARMQYADIRDFAPRDVFRRYDSLATKAKFESIPNHTWCLARSCKSGQVHPPGGTPKFRCKTCAKTHCVVHRVPWHRNETCAEYEYRTNKRVKRDEEAASRKIIGETTKRCPGCGRSIEKSFGCDHMTCTKCKQQFCWKCLATYEKKGARRVFHKQGCEYYNPEWEEI